MSIPIERLLAEARRLGNERGWTLYDICFRNAGVGVMWYTRPPITSFEGDVPPQWRDRLRIVKYYRSLREALRAEIRRMEADAPVA